MLRKLVLLSLMLVGCSKSTASLVAGQPCGNAAGAIACDVGTVCDAQSSICTCPAGATLCGTTCAVLATDSSHCGGCGLACPAGESCAAGRCSGGGCPQGALDCGGSCIDPKTNPAHCGGCAGAGGAACGNGKECLAGVCTERACAMGATQCPGGCVDLDSSAANCGACGTACPAGQVCSRGSCQASCAAGLTTCGTACADLNHDPNNCGSCGTVCGKEEICAADKGQVKCRDYRFASCNTCPCAACGDRSCCVIPEVGGGYSALCVEDNCPLP